MTFRKTILTETADLFKYSLGKLRLDPFRLHAHDEAFAVTLHTAGAGPGGHITSQLIGLPRCIIRGHHSEPHHLFLKQRHAEGLFQYRLQRWMRIFHRFFTLATAQVGMHHAAGDRTWSDDTDLDHKIVKVSWLEPRQHRHLGTAFDLKHPHSIAAADPIEGRCIFHWHGRHRKLDSTVLA